MHLKLIIKRLWSHKNGFPPRKIEERSGGSGLFADMEFELGPATETFLESEDFKSGKKRSWNSNGLWWREFYGAGTI